jgi:hypothetical protein
MNGELPSRLGDASGVSRTARVLPPEVDLGLDFRFDTARMKVALVAGVHPSADNRRWTLVARNGTPTSVLKGARLYAFTKAGCAAAREDGRGLRARLNLDDGWTVFVSRVLVEGPWNRPEAVTPAWAIEGLERPVPVDYHFD